MKTRRKKQQKHRAPFFNFKNIKICLESFLNFYSILAIAAIIGVNVQVITKSGDSSNLDLSGIVKKVKAQNEDTEWDLMPNDSLEIIIPEPEGNYDVEYPNTTYYDVDCDKADIDAYVDLALPVPSAGVKISTNIHVSKKTVKKTCWPGGSEAC